MKTKIIVVLSFVFVWIACQSTSEIEEEITVQKEFTYSFSNTVQEYTNATLSIGGFKDGFFVATETITIARLGTEDVSYAYAKEHNRWRPNLNLIEALPATEVYFSLKLSNDREELVQKADFLNPDSLQLSITEMEAFIEDEAHFLVYVLEDSVMGAFLGSDELTGD